MLQKNRKTERNVAEKQFFGQNALKVYRQETNESTRIAICFVCGSLAIISTGLGVEIKKVFLPEMSKKLEETLKVSAIISNKNEQKVKHFKKTM
jgi:hypothetical protein